MRILQNSFAGGVVEGYFHRLIVAGAGSPYEERNDGDGGVVPNHKVPGVNHLETYPGRLFPGEFFSGGKASSVGGVGSAYIRESSRCASNGR